MESALIIAQLCVLSSDSEVLKNRDTFVGGGHPAVSNCSGTAAEPGALFPISLPQA